MGVEISRILTTNSTGEPTRTFRGGDRIVFRLEFSAAEIPTSTPVQVRFHIRQLLRHGIGSGDRFRSVYVPMHFWKFDLTIDPGSWHAWTTWVLPDSEPAVGSMTMSEWQDLIFRDHWKMRSWAGPWDVTGFVGFTEPPREGQFDHSRERWVYEIWY